MTREPDLLLVAGDVHGNAEHLLYLYETAFNAEADAIFQVGDYGYWEHAKGGAAFLEMNSQLAVDNDLPLFWIDGNHESHTLLRERYGPGGTQHKPTPEGFWEIRPGVYYVPRGTRWTWSGRHLMGLGGAYSVDKTYRLKRDAKLRRKMRQQFEGRIHAGLAAKTPDYEAVQSWWPEEELTDQEIAKALEDPTPLDVLFTHDIPRGATPPWDRPLLDDCVPNQQRVQRVVSRLQPKLLIHGHLHLRYDQEIRCGDDGRVTHVMGLNCDWDRHDPRAAKRDPRDSWVMIKLTE